jgi:phosphoribosylglycinamide formyltransferase 1
MKKNIAIFASGEGTNAQRIIDYFRLSGQIRVSIIVSNKPTANVLKRAEKENIAVLIINKADFYESNTVINKLKDVKIDLIVLAGFLLMIPDSLVKAFPHKIINIHPALLPKFGGKGMYGMNVHKSVIESGEKQSGISIHYVNEHYDEGEIISQHNCEISENDTPETLALKIQKLEHEFFPKIIEKMLSENS